MRLLFLRTAIVRSQPLQLFKRQPWQEIDVNLGLLEQ